MSGAQSNPGASVEAISFHYDVGNEFYALWLDETMTYSCALWDDTDDLAAAQLAKLDYHIIQADAKGQERVLDVGCGWGAMVHRLASRAGVSKAVGLTLANNQADYIRSKGWAGVDVRTESWSTHVPEAPYGAIVSVGAFEHFARLGATSAEKVAGYRLFFERCHAWLRPGGSMSLQTMSYENSTRADFSPFFASQIFPESDLPRLHELVAATDGLFEVIAFRNDRHQYARTSLAWRHRLKARRAEAIDLVGKDVVERYEKYLQMWAIGFHIGTMGLIRVTLRKLERRL
jgi:cyclopropane-fatty-acyl-phospholipid synthase